VQLRSNKKLASEKRPETNLLSNEENEQWLNDQVERESAVARKRVEDADRAIKHEQEDIRNAGNVGLTS